VHPAAVVLRIYDISGQLVQTLVDEAGEAGNKTVQWDGCDARGDRVPAGVYFYILETGFSVDARQMILVE
jgi:flagellar hook assembly protein FlgD